MKKLSEVNEGIVSAIKTSFQITKANEMIIKHFEDEKYDNIDDIKRDLKSVAEKMYKKYVTNEGAPTFSQWFPNFEKSFLNSLMNK